MKGVVNDQTSLLTALRQRSNSSSKASVCSSIERVPGFPEKPAEVICVLPYPVVTAMNFINSSATSSFPRPGAGVAASGVDVVGGSSSGIAFTLSVAHTKPVIEFDDTICGNLDAALSREWIETNGIGGFASATINGAHTRRYHGLLTAALHPPVGRHVLLSKLEETVIAGGTKFELGVNLYPGCVHPEGYRFLRSFRLNPFPTFTYQTAETLIEKRVFMTHGENTTVVEYENIGKTPFELELRPLLAFRDYHSTAHANEAFNSEITEAVGQVSIRPYSTLPRLYFTHNAQSIARDGNWYHNFEYPVERERGLDFHEDLYQPFIMRFNLAPDAKAVVIASTEPEARNERARRAATGDSLVDALTAAADQFIVTRGGNLHTVIAGYHWFSDWGRDTMIALPGLTLVTGRYEIARDILLAFSQAANDGMLPNRFPDVGEQPEYNSVDASLWYFEAIRKFLDYTGDYDFVRDDLYGTMKSILHWYTVGARFGIHCDTDGLIVAGDPATQLTWMDAKIGDYVATPRSGKPVEIQALWYNALRLTESLAQQFGDSAEALQLGELASKTQQSFRALFWNETTDCFYDVIGDASVRPNQVIACSLGFPVADADLSRRALTVVERELLTGFGLRTLARSDPKYRPHCTGSQFERDSCYHQGTVWPWLLGPFITAYLRSFPNDREKTLGWLARFPAHLREAGLGTISEIFDGDEPHAPRGCIAQAWSVAEILRALVEDLNEAR